MGWGLYAVFKIYNKETGKCEYKKDSGDRYKVPSWTMQIDVNQKYVNNDNYYGSITWGTCDDPNQAMCWMNGEWMGKSTSRSNLDELNPSLVEKLRSDVNKTVHLYNRVISNFPITTRVLQYPSQK